MCNVRRYISGLLLSAVVALAITFAPAPAQAQEPDVCAAIETAIANVEGSNLPQRAKDAIIEQLVRLAEAYGCEGD